jgi:hypothetical protein
VIEYYMNPEVHIEKAHPRFVGRVKILNSDQNAVSWEQRFKIMGMNLRTVVKSSLNRKTSTIVTQSIDGTGKGTSMIRTFKEIPTETEIHFTFSPKLGALGSFFLRARAKKGFEETVDEDMKALDSVAQVEE